MAKQTTNTPRKAAAATRAPRTAITEPASDPAPASPVPPAARARRRARTRAAESALPKAAASKRRAPKVATAPAPRAKPVVRNSNATRAPRAKQANSFTEAEIALRAYFIAEQREQNGGSGDATSDWIEAERQLRAAPRLRV